MVRRARHEESMELSSIGESVYAAEAVLKKRTVNDQEEYLIKWKGWSIKYSTWEPKENILDERLFKAFERQQELEEQPKKRRRRRKKLQASQSIAPLDDFLPAIAPIETHDQCTGTDTPPPEVHDRVPIVQEHVNQTYDAPNGEVPYESEPAARVSAVTSGQTHDMRMCYELESVIDESKNGAPSKKTVKHAVVETKPKAKRGRPKLLIKFVNKKIKEVKQKTEKSPVHVKKKKKKLHWKQRAKLEAQLQASLLAAAELANKQSVVGQPQSEVLVSNPAPSFNHHHTPSLKHSLNYAPSLNPGSTLVPAQTIADPAQSAPVVVPDVIPKPVRKRGRPRKHPLKTPPTAIVPPPPPPVEQPISPGNVQKQRRFPDYKLMAEKEARHNKRNKMSIWRPSNELLNSVLVTDVSVGGLMVTIKENLH